MKIYFVRHGQTKVNQERIFCGQQDWPTTDLGLEQARQLAYSISSDFTLIYTSDLLRCKQMVEILNTKLNLPVVVDARLRERHFGSLQGTSVALVDHLPPEEKNKLIVEKGGESFEDLGKRIFACIEDIKKNHPNDKILIVTSGGVIRLLYKVLENKIFEMGGIPNGSMHEFEF